MVDRLTAAIFLCATGKNDILKPVAGVRLDTAKIKTDGGSEMILADKIILERKKCGWSQEELADKLGVTRQAVSKWEGAQTTPDLQRILEMSRLFGVSVDYLIKDEVEEEEHVSYSEEVNPAVHRVRMEEASEFLRVKQETAPKIAFGVTLCILSPICMLLLAGCAEVNLISLSEEVAGGIGLMILLAIVAGACGIFIACGSRTKPYEFLDKEMIETEYGVVGMVKEKKQRYQGTYTKYNIVGTITCIIAAMALLAGVFFEGNEMLEVLFFCLMLIIVSIGVRFFVIAGITQSSFDKLLQEGDYSAAEKANAPIRAAVSGIYWLVVTAIFLALGFMGREWRLCGFIWPVAGVLFPVVLIVVRMFERGGRTVKGR